MPAQPSSPHRRIAARGLLGTLAGIAALAFVGAVYQTVGSALDRRSQSPPGRHVQVEGQSMHLHCTGRGAPVVVLEAGAIGFAQTWGWVQSELAAHTRVCSYDRAGMGWSETAPGAYDARSAVRRLRALLHAAGEPGPWVLVGHSMGGSFVQVFAGLHPRDVAAVGLVDPSHPDQLDRFGSEIRAQQEDFHDMIGMSATLAHFGLLRATDMLGRLAQGLPERDLRAARMFGASPRHLRTAHAELLAWDETMRAAREVNDLGQLPLLVISATEAMEGMPRGFIEVNQLMHAELAALSTRGDHRLLEGSDHYSLLMNRGHAAEVAAMLRDLVEAARATNGSGAR